MKHGHCSNNGKSLEYYAWAHMIQRCYNPNDNRYYKYGARGIRVCDRWIGENGFINFIADIGEKPSKELSLDRIENDKDYYKDNCRWATRVEQIRNRTITKMVEYNGEVKSLPEWCEVFSLPYKTIFKRLSVGWSVEKTFTTKVRYMKPYGKAICSL